MHSAIIAVPKPNDIDQQKWLAFSKQIDSLDGDKAVEHLADNVWQINFQLSPGAVARLVGAAEDFRLAYRILPLDADHQWIRIAAPKPAV